MAQTAQGVMARLHRIFLLKAFRYVKLDRTHGGTWNPF